MNEIKYILDHFGIKNQLKKYKEENRELFEALRGDSRQHTLEELADVSEVLDQLIYYYTAGKPEKVKDIRKFKRHRTLQRIKSGYYDKEEL
jgi:predicted house-cleaning noncanonical NTP pyrophosphatase (MazG superfamily)